jgi:hypothetical protein
MLVVGEEALDAREELALFTQVVVKRSSSIHRRRLKLIDLPASLL